MQNALKTHCSNGHEYTAENAYAHANAGRRCKTCHIAKAAARYRSRPKVEPKTMDELYWAKVDKRLGLGPQGDCWQWTGALSNGYGSITRKGKMHHAHRVSFEIANGPIPKGLFICHRCDNPLCVNPAHLFSGTHGDNVRDMTAKGRQWQQRKTHCPQGHPYATETTRLNVRGHRKCGVCKNARDRARLLVKKEQA